MALSNVLISEFVKVTNDDKKIHTGATVYGTAKEYDGAMYVQLDGSDLLTPIETTTNIKDGERVTVTVKNHTATVGGNLSSPAARDEEVKEVDGKVEEVNGKVDEFEVIIADKVSTDELEANYATIKKLEAEYATIEHLEAEYATIEHLQADYATIGKLEAEYATIKHLEAEYASIDHLEAEYATIKELEAVSIKTGTLEAEVAEIDTLIFGSASGDSIHSSFSNAVVAQISDAQIKSAMIESLVASKITAGDIVTNNVRVVSEDGSLIIADETIQISDGTRVRVQIGKDASDDYSINVWDADGKLMFSEGGITDNAIKGAIIRNDMVSDTANISAFKLDIDSLFTAINEDGSNTIKSTQIYLNDEEQTLDLAFKEMTTLTTETAETVSSQGTQLSVIQGQIDSKIWQEDIEKALDGSGESMNTQYSELRQDIDTISATVAQHTTDISSKADSSTVTTVSNKVSDLELSLDGFKTTVSETYSTKEEVEDINGDITTLQGRMTSAESSIQQNANSITSNVKSIENNEAAAAQANSGVEENGERLTSAESTIQQLADSIAMLVTDENGASLMTQTENGWTFSMAETNSTVNNMSQQLNELQESTGSTQATVEALESAVNDIGETMEYVRITVYEDEPCIELGESDSDYSLMITNTRIMFRVGSSVPTLINSSGLVTENIEVKNELRHGNYVWMQRSNGHYSLQWKEVTN